MYIGANTKRLQHPRRTETQSLRSITASGSRANLRGPQPIILRTPSSPAYNSPSRPPSVLDKFAEPEEEDYDQSFDNISPDSTENGKLELTKKLSSKSWVGRKSFDLVIWFLLRSRSLTLSMQLGEEDPDEEDPFAELGGSFSDVDESLDDLQANMQRDKVSKMCSFVNDLLDGMSAEADELAIRDGCIYLVGRRVACDR